MLFLLLSCLLTNDHVLPFIPTFIGCAIIAVVSALQLANDVLPDLPVGAGQWTIWPSHHAHGCGLPYVSRVYDVGYLLSTLTAWRPFIRPQMNALIEGLVFLPGTMWCEDYGIQRVWKQKGAYIKQSIFYL